MTTIGIVGAGIAGLHLALHLQKHGVPVTLYTDRSLEELGSGRLPSSVALMGATRGRDTALGTNRWDKPELGTHAVDIRVQGTPIAFRGALAEPFLFLDMRVYLPSLMNDFAQRGGKVVVARCGPDDLETLAGDHDLVVVATGRAGLTAMFPRIPERSPYLEPQRRLAAGLFRGVRFPSPFVMKFNIVPGHGEVFENQFLTHGGKHVTGLLIEAVPGGALEAVTRLVYEDDPAVFNAAFLAVLREHAPDTYERADPAAFGLTAPLDTLSGAIVPTGRRGWAPLAGGRFAIAVGDTHITHDPLTGQGANAASRAAWLLGELVTQHAHAGGRFDEAFCADAERRLWESTRATAEWSNAFLQPPPPHAIGLLAAAAQNQAIADAFVTNFNDPNRQWQVLSSPEATAAFIASFGPPPG